VRISKETLAQLAHAGDKQAATLLATLGPSGNPEIHFSPIDGTYNLKWGIRPRLPTMVGLEAIKGK
jgi:hypothetical protein